MLRGNDDQRGQPEHDYHEQDNAASFEKPVQRKKQLKVMHQLRMNLRLETIRQGKTTEMGMTASVYKQNVTIMNRTMIQLLKQLFERR